LSRNSTHSSYENPLTARYAAPATSHIFSPDFKFSTWRRLWLALAEAEMELGVAITRQQLDEMASHLDSIDYKRVGEIEAETRHDVVAHLKAFAEQCPGAGAVMHLGATSAFVGDNTDVIQLREGLKAVVSGLVCVIHHLGEFAARHKDTPALGYTHFQPAQPTTVGKRATLWMQDLLLDLAQAENMLDALRIRGVKGTTGTQASFLKLFDGDHDKVKKLDRLVAQKMGFSATYAVTGQTYPRKVDFQVLAVLAGVGQSAHKFANDVRLLSQSRQLGEPFGAGQVGSSAMAYKRNPMRCELMTSLARHVQALVLNPAMTACEQWLERTLDDSANRRIAIPEAFMATEIILRVYENVVRGLDVNEDVIRAELERELPFMATEEVIIQAVGAGAERLEVHEAIRVHSMAAMERVKQGEGNDLIERLRGDAIFHAVDLESIADAGAFIGRAPQQVEDFLRQDVTPLLEKYSEVVRTEAQETKRIYAFE